jgi:hypothetical protein
MLLSNEMVPPVSVARSIRDEASFMQSAGYFREQAAQCLEIARHISDFQAVDKLRARAAEHFASAHEVERHGGGGRRHGSQNTGMAERVKPRSRGAVCVWAQGFTRDDSPGEDEWWRIGFDLAIGARKSPAQGRAGPLV